jgi:hypothetical protein
MWGGGRGGLLLSKIGMNFWVVRKISFPENQIPAPRKVCVHQTIIITNHQKTFRGQGHANMLQFFSTLASSYI